MINHNLFSLGDLWQPFLIISPHVNHQRLLLRASAETVAAASGPSSTFSGPHRGSSAATAVAGAEQPNSLVAGSYQQHPQAMADGLVTMIGGTSTPCKSQGNSLGMSVESAQGDGSSWILIILIRLSNGGPTHADTIRKLLPSSFSYCINQKWKGNNCVRVTFTDGNIIHHVDMVVNSQLFLTSSTSCCIVVMKNA